MKLTFMQAAIGCICGYCPPLQPAIIGANMMAKSGRI
jgi:hypothetical protein